MSNELMRPIDPETAHAIEEAANLGSKIVEAGTKAGGYLDRVFGRVPNNFVGVLFGDWLVHKRIRRWAKLQAETSEHLRRWGAKEPYEEISPSIAIPLIEAAVDEDREALTEIWSKLLAAAMHPERKGLVRQSFIALVKQMDPLDALVLKELEQNSNWSPNSRDALASKLATSADEIEVSFGNLIKLGCLGSNNIPTPGSNPYLMVSGRLMMRAIRG